MGGALLALCIVTSVGEVCYWLSYNAYFAAVGDAEHRGHQLGVREAVVAVAGIVAPLLGAWALVTAGSRWTFAAVGLIQAIAAVPLLGAPNVAVRQEAPGALRAARQRRNPRRSRRLDRLLLLLRLADSSLRLAP